MYLLSDIFVVFLPSLWLYFFFFLVLLLAKYPCHQMVKTRARYKDVYRRAESLFKCWTVQQNSYLIHHPHTQGEHTCRYICLPVSAARPSFPRTSSRYRFLLVPKVTMNAWSRAPWEGPLSPPLGTETLRNPRAGLPARAAVCCPARRRRWQGVLRLWEIGGLQ